MLRMQSTCSLCWEYSRFDTTSYDSPIALGLGFEVSKEGPSRIRHFPQLLNRHEELVPLDGILLVNLTRSILPDFKVRSQNAAAKTRLNKHLTQGGLKVHLS